MLNVVRHFNGGISLHELQVSNWLLTRAEAHMLHSLQPVKSMHNGDEVTEDPGWEFKHLQQLMELTQ